MILKASVDFSPLMTQLQQLEDALQDKLLLAASKAAGNVYKTAYESAVPDYLPTGTYKVGDQVEHFQQLHDSIGMRTLMFSDKSGAYAVVGVKAAPGSHNPLAPQGWWIEEGTDEREHADGHPTGKVEPMHILAQVAEACAVPAQEEALRVLLQGINSVLGT